jgi:hypothetical protein
MPAAARSLSSTASRSNGPTSDKPLYASQSSLPKLPVPSLSSTFHKYLESIQPHLTPEEFAHSKSNLSNTLQARLEGRAAEKESWLSEWWNEAAYMGYRDSIVPNVNYFYLHKKGLAKGKSQTERAAELIRGVREFRDLVVRYEVALQDFVKQSLIVLVPTVKGLNLKRSRASLCAQSPTSKCTLIGRLMVTKLNTDLMVQVRRNSCTNHTRRHCRRLPCRTGRTCHCHA